MDYALLAATALAITGGWRGNPAAWPLVGSVVFMCISRLAGVEFTLPVWIAVDLITAALVLAVGRLDWRTWTVVMLIFPMAWLYFQPDPLRYFGTNSITITQLLLVAPWGWLAAGLGPSATAMTRRRDEFDLRVRQTWGG